MNELDQNIDLELPVDDSDDQDRVVDLDLGQDNGRSQPTIITSTPRRNRSRSRLIDLGEHAQPSTSRARSSSNNSVNKNVSDPDNESGDDEGSEIEVDITLPRLQEVPDLATNESLTRSKKKQENDYVYGRRSRRI